MFTLLVCIALAAIAGKVRRGSFETLASRRFRWVPLLFAALVVQVGAEAWEPSWMTSSLAVGTLIVTNLAVLAFLWANRTLAGMWLAAVGLLMNVVVISVNRAMPVSREAVLDSGLPPDADLGLKHEILNDSTVLPWLADVIPVAPFREVLSVGDAVLAMGIGVVVYAAMLGERRRGAHLIG